MTDTQTAIAGVTTVIADIRATAADWMSDGFDTGDVIGTLSGYAEDLDKALKGELPPVSPTFPVTFAIVSLPMGIPSLQALAGMLPSIREDQPSHYATVQALVRFLSTYGDADAAEAASTEEGEAFGMALDILTQLSVSEAVRFDAQLNADIHAGMTVAVARDPDERRVHQELAEMAATPIPVRAVPDADEIRVRGELAEMASAAPTSDGIDDDERRVREELGELYGAETDS